MAYHACRHQWGQGTCCEQRLGRNPAAAAGERSCPTGGGAADSSVLVQQHPGCCWQASLRFCSCLQAVQSPCSLLALSDGAPGPLGSGGVSSALSTETLGWARSRQGQAAESAAAVLSTALLMCRRTAARHPPLATPLRAWLSLVYPLCSNGPRRDHSVACSMAGQKMQTSRQRCALTGTAGASPTKSPPPAGAAPVPRRPLGTVRALFHAPGLPAHPQSGVAVPSLRALDPQGKVLPCLQRSNENEPHRRRAPSRTPRLCRRRLRRTPVTPPTCRHTT